jgi:hypothetical protein
MQVRVAHSAGLDANQHFIRAGYRTLDFFKCKRLFEIVQDGGSHSHPFGERLETVR